MLISGQFPTALVDQSTLHVHATDAMVTAAAAAAASLEDTCEATPPLASAASEDDTEVF